MDYHRPTKGTSMRDSFETPTRDPRRCGDAVGGSRRGSAAHPRIVGVLLLTLVVLACGTTEPPTPTATPTPTPSTASNPAIDVTADGLHIQTYGLSCASPAAPSGVNFGAWLVLATTQLTYDASDLQQMRDYLGSLRSLTGATPGPTPSTLKWVHGAPTTSQIGPYRGVLRFYTPAYCFDDLQITNTSTSPIQISQAGLRLQAVPQPNPLQYRLIDVCSLGGAIVQFCQLNQGASDLCIAYDVQIQLARGASGAEDLAAPVGLDPYKNPCPALIISPGAQVDLSLNFGSAEPLVYFGALEFKLQTAAGQQQTLVLSQAPSTLTFADPSQFTCYGLQGTTFTVEAQGAAALQGLTSNPQTGLAEGCA
jgi:hypothetical protein